MQDFWFFDTVIYHMYVPSLAEAPFFNDYSQSRHSLSEIAKWAEHIKALGCNAVLFSPVLKAKTHGYDVTDYFVIDNRLGANAEFKELVAHFHSHGVKVILDSVFNHCGRDFFAFKELQNGNREYADWFCGVDFSRGSPLGDNFTYANWSGHFELPKFNLKNHAAKKYLLDAAKFWIEEFGIDGMRLDAANELDFDFMGELRALTTSLKPDFWLMGEVVHGDYSRWIGDNALHSVTNYIIFKSLFSSHNDNNMFELLHCLQNVRPQNGLPLYNFVDNHDQPRIASNVKTPEFLRTLYALLFTLPGVPSIYYGSEWGITGKKEGNSDAPMRPYIDIENPPCEILWLEGYIKSLADIRHKQKALRLGAFRSLSLEYQKPFVFERAFEDKRVIVAVNINANEEKINLSSHVNQDLTELLTGKKVANEKLGEVVIAPYSAGVFV